MNLKQAPPTLAMSSSFQRGHIRFMSRTPRRKSRPWRNQFWAALKREPDVVETLAGPIRSLEILAGLLALINPAPVVSLLLGSPMN